MYSIIKRIGDLEYFRENYNNAIQEYEQARTI